tara:strand:- start:1762 stop:2277 length:516 start_codon:yes stop_codon:yes gene_type:complete
MAKSRNIKLPAKKKKARKKPISQAGRRAARTDDKRGRLVRQNAFLHELEETRGCIALSCDRVGVPRATFYNWKENHPEFLVKYEDKMEKIKDLIEFKGIIRPSDNGVYHAATRWLSANASERGYNVNRLELAGSVKIESPTLEEVMEKTDPVTLAAAMRRVEASAAETEND